MTVNAPRSTFAVIVVIATFAVTSQRLGRPNELEVRAGAIGALRAITSGETTYAAMNGGAYDTPECLLSAACVPGMHAVSGFLSPDLADLRDHRGYRLEFHAGPKAAWPRESTHWPSAMSRYAVVAGPLPSQPAILPRFCVDDRGIIYVIAAGATPRVEDGRCLDTATPVQ